MSDTNGNDPYGQQNNPDPYGDTPSSNPYGSPLPPPSPYSSGPQWNPTGGDYGAPATPTKTDGVSIAALVTSLLGCLCGVGFIAGIVLGIIGMRRTKDGRAKGRGMAIAGLVIGIIGTIVAVVAVVALIIFGVNQVVTPSSAKVGQCVDIDTHSGNKVSMIKKSCTDKHDGEIVAVGRITSDNLAEAGQVKFCTDLISPADQAKLLGRPELRLNSVTENPDDMKVGDHVACYVDSSSKLTDDLLK